MLQAIVLGLVQGLTEFLPVSSSGHLIIARKILNIDLSSTLEFDVILHFATLLVIILYFWSDIYKIIENLISEKFSYKSSKTILSIIVGTIPAVLVGYFWKDILERTFRNPEYVAYSLILGSIVFFIADKVSKGGPTNTNNIYDGVNLLKGFFIGLFQSLALIPGVSRSGMTISGGLFSRLSREEAIKYAFLLGIPAIAGAMLKTILDTESIKILLSNPNIYIAGVTAFVSGLWSIHFLVRYIKNNSFTPFIIYRVVLAILVLSFI